MESLYFYTAVVGGSVLVLQTLMLILGLTDLEGAGDDADGFDPDQSHAFFKLLSFKTLVAFITFFGLTGMACNQAGLGSLPTALASVAAGSVAFFLVAQLMGAMLKLQSDGTVDLDNAVGEVGEICLRVPGHRSGQGKVNVVVQGRKVECKALTSGDEIPSGTPVRILEVLGSGALSVLPLEKEST